MTVVGSESGFEAGGITRLEEGNEEQNSFIRNFRLSFIVDDFISAGEGTAAGAAGGAFRGGE